jgi:hypothetical protein
LGLGLARASARQLMMARDGILWRLASRWVTMSVSVIAPPPPPGPACAALPADARASLPALFGLHYGCELAEVPRKEPPLMGSAVAALSAGVARINAFSCSSQWIHDRQ